jgi:hypothetical protein
VYTEISNIIGALRITDALTAGEILHAKGLYSTLQSARVNAQKKLNQLSDLGQIEKCDGFYRMPDCKSEFKEHSKILTKALSLIIISHPEAIIHREPTIKEIALRPDSIVLLKRENMGRCFILEVCNNETEIYLRQKIDVWNTWPQALGYLSNLFGYKIPHFEIAVYGETVIDGTIPLMEVL